MTERFKNITHIVSSRARAMAVATLIAAGCLSPLRAENIVEKIQTESNGNVIIEIPSNILDQLLQASSKKESTHDIKPGINKLTGYRIQVFSDGRNQHTLEARAKARGSAILAKFPKYRGQVYTYSKSPNWYTRIGNFKSNAEANSALSELKRAFPNYASEMRVVKCQIVIIKQ